MNPQIVVQDFGGAHNADAAGTSARLIRGASWKHQRVVVVMPTAETVPAKVVLSWLNLAFAPNNAVHRVLALGMEVGQAYSTAIEQIVAHPELSQWEYILTLEHDNAPPPDGVLRLLEHMEAHPEFACIGGAYFTKGPGGVLQAWGDVRDPIVNFRPVPPDLSGGLVECYGTGMGFNLWRMSLFKDARLRKPWFVTQTKGGLSTQDLYAWMDFRKYGYRCAVACDVKTGHYDLTGAFGVPDKMW